MKRFFFAIVAFFWGCTYVSQPAEEAAPLRIEALDVGQGLSLLMDYGGKFALYDIGPDSVGVLDTLKNRGVDTLEWVVLSHFHRDHVGGVLEMAARRDFPHIRKIFVSRDSAESEIRDSVMTVIRMLGFELDTLTRGRRLAIFGDGVFKGPEFSALWPTDYGRVGGNGASVVLLVEFGEATALLTGDLDTASEKALLELSPTIHADLLQVGHHGSRGSSSLEFVSRVSPRYAFVSVGKGNSYGHPKAEVLRKLDFVIGDSNKVYRTDRDGSLSFSLYDNLGVLPP